MRSEMVTSICRAGIFILCAQVIVHFRPAKSYEKYLKMLVSAMILVQLLQPLGAIWKDGGTDGLTVRIRWYEEQLKAAGKRAETDSAAGEKLREQMTLEEVRRRVEEQGRDVTAEERDVWEGEGTTVEREMWDGAGETAGEQGTAGERREDAGGIRIETIRPVETIRIDPGEGGEQGAELEGAGEDWEDPEDPLGKMVPSG